MLDYILIVWPYYLKLNTQIGFVVFQFQCFFSFLTSGWTRTFFSMCRRPSCSYQDPRSHNYKIKSQQWVFFTELRGTHTDYSNEKWIFSLFWTCTSILRRSCSKGRSRCLRPLGLLLVNAEQSNNHPLPFWWIVKVAFGCTVNCRVLAFMAIINW